MAVHAKNALRGPSIAQVFDLSLAISTSEAGGAEGLVTSEDCQVLDLVSAGTAAVGAVVTNEGAIAEKKEVRVGVEEGATGVTTEAVKMPSVSGCRTVSGGLFQSHRGRWKATRWRGEEGQQKPSITAWCSNTVQRGRCKETGKQASKQGMLDCLIA